ncbi:flagellar biosynthetic protein FliO [Neorhizobium sp. NCHU2750]|uniref:flagellar biosynthetic protein FliO n=1 Tax=Neorhizobium sp. NCHU2750 TaxID=1825976 RepID=UPI000E763D12|nr:hypothetical protein NCHU2750_17490 [Neorhizobium sp. NCHU2750]
MLADVMGDYGSRLVVAVIGVGFALLCLVGILWIVRGRRGPSPFVRGGRNRQPRLQVLDAAAVDTRRRLVLVRRDDVEHLIMIGGPTDIVVESRITSASKSTEERLPEPAPIQALPAAAAPRAIAADSQRPVPPVPPRPEPVREPAIRDPRLDARTVAPPVPAVAPSRVEPSVAAPVVDSRDAVSSTTPVSRAEPVARQPLIDDAARLLDSERDRVFAERPAPQPAPVARPAPAAALNVSSPVSAAGDRATSPLGSDFEKILEQEMENNMAARDAAAARASRPALPGATDAGMPVGSAGAPAAAAAPKNDPTLQSEVARIFGEMSASRDK